MRGLRRGGRARWGLWARRGVVAGPRRAEGVVEEAGACHGNAGPLAEAGPCPPVIWWSVGHIIRRRRLQTGDKS